MDNNFGRILEGLMNSCMLNESSWDENIPKEINPSTLNKVKHLFKKFPGYRTDEGQAAWEKVLKEIPQDEALALYWSLYHRPELRKEFGVERSDLSNFAYASHAIHGGDNHWAYPEGKTGEEMARGYENVPEVVPFDEKNYERGPGGPVKMKVETQGHQKLDFGGFPDPMALVDFVKARDEEMENEDFSNFPEGGEIIVSIPGLGEYLYVTEDEWEPISGGKSVNPENL